MTAKIWKLILVATALSMTLCSAATAAPTWPSAIGSWSLVGQERISGNIKHHHGGSSVRDFAQTITMNDDHTFDVAASYSGTWSQVKNKVNLKLDEAMFEAIVNEYLQEMTGYPDLYVTIDKSSGQAMLAKDGLTITTGKIAIKFDIRGTVQGAEVKGKGTYFVHFTGIRAVGAVLKDTTEETPELVKSFAEFLATTFLTTAK